MTFIASSYEKWKGRITVWERVDGQRVTKTYQAPYYFYVQDPAGTYRSLAGQPLKKLTFKTLDEFDEGVKSHVTRFESDFSPLEKAMMDLYAGKPAPKLNVGFIDIEVDYDQAIGFAGPLNPYAPINALTLCTNGQFVTIAVPPPGSTGNEIEDLITDNYFIVPDERALLELFFSLLDEVDVLSGWNSEFYDIPYIGKRVELLFGDRGLYRLGFPGAQSPRWSERERFKGSKEKEPVLELGSRVHLDFLRLFRKFNLEGRPSFSLAAIADDELDVPKLAYEGTLADLYKNDFRTFCLYNRRDTEILWKLDQKFKYIELANQMVHEATVNFSAIFGSVQLIDTAITNFAHQRGLIVHDRQYMPGETVEGALVLNPKIGLSKWIGSIDVNSLYPSTYRALNLSPEKIVGQLMEYEAGWRAVYQAKIHPDNDLYRLKEVTLLMEGDTRDKAIRLTVGDLMEIIEEKKLALSAYGTLLDQASGEGILPAVLSYWFNGRKELQAKKKAHGKAADALLKAGKLKDDPEYLEEKRLEEYYDMLQGVRKVLLNSTYGATLNEYCRFHDPRLGASTTGSGRQITTHMINTVAKALCGDDAPQVVKTVIEAEPKKAHQGGAGGFSRSEEDGISNVYTIDTPVNMGPIYGDTDSCYFTVAGAADDEETAVQLIDSVADFVNGSFSDFLQTAFFCQPEFSTVIKAAREVVATSGIFRAKKKYILLVCDLEGKKLTPDDPKALKTMGSDIKITSVPLIIRNFLKDVTIEILKGTSKDKIDEMILEFRRGLRRNPDVNPMDYASISSVRTLEEYFTKWELVEKPGRGRVTMPANVRSAINHNHFLDMIEDKAHQRIIPGQKIKMLWLKPNEFEFTTIALSSDAETLPQWFIDYFKVDLELTEKKLIDQKLGNIFEPIGWEVPTEQVAQLKRLFEF